MNDLEAHDGFLPQKIGSQIVVEWREWSVTLAFSNIHGNCDPWPRKTWKCLFLEYANVISQTKPAQKLTTGTSSSPCWKGKNNLPNLNAFLIGLYAFLFFEGFHVFFSVIRFGELLHQHYLLVATQFADPKCNCTFGGFGMQCVKNEVRRPDVCCCGMMFFGCFDIFLTGSRLSKACKMYKHRGKLLPPSNVGGGFKPLTAISSSLGPLQSGPLSCSYKWARIYPVIFSHLQRV